MTLTESRQAASEKRSCTCSSIQKKPERIRRLPVNLFLTGQGQFSTWTLTFTRLPAKSESSAILRSCPTSREGSLMPAKAQAQKFLNLMNGLLFSLRGYSIVEANQLLFSLVPLSLERRAGCRVLEFQCRRWRTMLFVQNPILKLIWHEVHRRRLSADSKSICATLMRWKSWTRQTELSRLALKEGKWRYKNYDCFIHIFIKYVHKYNMQYKKGWFYTYSYKLLVLYLYIQKISGMDTGLFQCFIFVNWTKILLWKIGNQIVLVHVETLLCDKQQ